jgi:hypothetical protein
VTFKTQSASKLQHRIAPTQASLRSR